MSSRRWGIGSRAATQATARSGSCMACAAKVRMTVPGSKRVGGSAGGRSRRPTRGGSRACRRRWGTAVIDPVDQEFHARNYQAEAISFILGRPFSGLIMRPGLGKTACVCVARIVLKKKKLGKRLLVVAPYNVASMVWHEEILKWNFPLKIGFAHGPKFEEDIKDKTLDVVTMTCDGLSRLYAEFTPHDIYKLFDHLCVDESTKFKHISSKR